MANRAHLAALVGRVPTEAPYRKYLLASYAENTTKAYQSDIRHFRRWGGEIPCSSMKLAHYLATYAGRLTHATLSRRVAAVHHEHLRKGLRSPAQCEVVRATLRGIGRTFSRSQRRVQPLLPRDLRRMQPYMRGIAGARDKALLLLGFMGGFRRSELVALNVEDVEVSRAGLHISVRSSKTDQDGTGRVVRVPRLGNSLCAVRPVERWLTLLRPSGPLFLSLNTRGGPTRRRLEGHSVANIVKKRVSQIGLDPSLYSGHSLRAGFVTSAAASGALPWQIKEQTGHKSDAVLARYIRDGGAAGADVIRHIAGK